MRLFFSFLLTQAGSWSTNVRADDADKVASQVPIAPLRLQDAAHAARVDQSLDESL